MKKYVFPAITLCILVAGMAVLLHTSDAERAQRESFVPYENSGVMIYAKANFDSGKDGFTGVKKSEMNLVKDSVSGKAIKTVCREKWAGPGFSFNIQGSHDLKMAFMAKGHDFQRAALNVYDQKAKDNTTPYGYRTLPDNEWRPVLYSLDRFRYNSKRSGFVKEQTRYSGLRFFSPQPSGGEVSLTLDNFIIYRGSDHEPPRKVTGLTAEQTDEGIALSWEQARDNTFPMVYVIARSSDDRKFRKIAEAFTTRYEDKTAGKGKYQYKVLACDFENNIGPWSQAVQVVSNQAAQKKVLTREEKDRLKYAEHIRNIWAKGKGKVQKGKVLLYGDSLTGATIYPYKVAAELGIYEVAARGYASKRTGWGRKNVLTRALEPVNPEFMLVLFGTNNVRGHVHDRETIAKWMDDLQAIVEAAESRGTVPILGTIPPHGFKDPKSKPESMFNSMLIKRAKELKVPVAYIFKEIESSGDRRQFIWKDGVHWTPDGMEAAARAWGKAMRQVGFALRHGGAAVVSQVRAQADTQAGELDPQERILDLKAPDVVRLKATADIWLSNANEKERRSSSGRVDRFKLKSIQEMAVIRFNARPIKGKKVLAAKLFLHPIQQDNQLRYLRISTVNQDWVEGTSTRVYGPPNGATYLYADSGSQRSWAWPGSEFCDASFSSGHTMSTWAERRKRDGGWISVNVEPKLVQAMTVGDTDGLAVMDGGTIALFNNYVYSSESGQYAPYILCRIGPDQSKAPPKPKVQVGPAPEMAGITSGAVKIRIKGHAHVLCWRVFFNDRKLDRWRIPHPEAGQWKEFIVDGLSPNSEAVITVTAVSKTGKVSPTVCKRTQVSSSRSQAFDLETLSSDASPRANQHPVEKLGGARIWAVPSLVKVSPVTSKPMHKDVSAACKRSNAVWDGSRISLFGIRGEAVDFQLCIEKTTPGPKRFTVSLDNLLGPEGSRISRDAIELFKDWYSKTQGGQWQPAYLIPWENGRDFSIPDKNRGISDQSSQLLSVDIQIPKSAQPGQYVGSLKVKASPGRSVQIPISLRIYDFVMPDKLAFWPEMNAYHIPDHVLDYYRLAQRYRCVANFWVFRPKFRGQGKNIKVLWDKYDQQVGPLLNGEAFQGNPRSGHAQECLYLPFLDSWPTPLTKETYDYNGYWPGQGDSKKYLVRHSLHAPPINEALSRDYKQAFLEVQRQFIQHFRDKGWTNTEMQCFFGGKETHRIDYGVNMWWTTDEPYKWEDWLALRFFTRLWTKGRLASGASAKLWTARADISRPQWQGTVLDGIVNAVYYGGFDNHRTYKRCSILHRQTGIKVRAYGAANAHDTSNTRTVSLVLSSWLNGADAYLPWQTLGKPASLDVQESTSGNAIFVPGGRFGLPVVADMRLIAFRKGEQLIEYLVKVADANGLSRDQLKKAVLESFGIDSDGNAYGARKDKLRSRMLPAWKIEQLRRRLLEALESGDQR